MKKLCCLFTLLLLCTCLYSVSYSSNSLGQLTDGMYSAEIDGNIRKIFKNGELFKTITETEIGNSLIVCENNLSTGIETVYVYQNGLLQSVTEGSNCTSYVYDDNSSLDYIVESKEDQIVEIQYFIKSPVDGSLVGVKRYDNLYLYSENYIISQDKVLYSASGFVMTDKPFTINDNNQIEVAYEDGTTKVYSNDGKLVKTSFDSKDVIYEYNQNGILNKTVTTQDNLKTVDYYRNNEIFKSENYLNDSIQDIIEYGCDGYYKVQKIFRNSVHIATVWYKTNSISATKIEYLGGLI